jgi:hypothetical protein
MNIAVTEPSPIEIDPRPCNWCGLKIDRHVMIDDGEGPEFWCQEVEPTAANLVVQWELADPRDRWKHTGEAPPLEIKPRPAVLVYRTPQATIDAFWYVASLDDPDYLKRWLSEHPRDVLALQKLWEAKHARA